MMNDNGGAFVGRRSFVGGQMTYKGGFFVYQSSDTLPAPLMYTCA
jgi:hypothetical protein